MNDQNILFFDVGNTNVKLGLGRRSAPFEVSCLGAFPTVDTTPQTITEATSELCHRAGIAPGDVNACVACSVVPSVNATLADTVPKCTGRRVSFAPYELPLGFDNQADIPANVGADRLAGAYGARCLFADAEHLVIIDFGTATTVDCVRSKVYLGGLTCPGLQTSATALSQETALLPPLTLELDDPGIHLGFDTMQSLNQGFLHGFAAMAEGLVARLTGPLGGTPLVIATGGLARTMATLTPVIDHVQENLVMIGLHQAHLERDE